MRALKWMLVASMLCLLAVPAMADGVFDVTGSLTISGNDVCGGAACVETLDFSFEVTWVQFAPGQFNPEILPGTTASSSGPLGSFAPAGPGSIANNFIQFFNTQGDEIDISVLNAPVASAPQALQLANGFGGGYIYGCQTAVCVADFAPPGFVPPAFGLFTLGTVQYTETAVPEASTILYLLIGLVLVSLVYWHRLGERGRPEPHDFLPR